MGNLDEIKAKIDCHINNLYSKNINCKTREELENKLSLQYFPSDLVKDINSNKEVEAYYIKEKVKILEKFELRFRNKDIEDLINNILIQQTENDINNMKMQEQLRYELFENKKKIRELEEKNQFFLAHISKQQEDLLNHQNYLFQIQQKNKEELEQKEKAIESITEQYKNNIKIMQQKMNEEKKEFEEKQKKAEENNKKIIEDLEKKIQEEKDELKKKELMEQQELNKKKEKLRIEFNKKMEKIKTEEISIILKNFDKIKKNFCFDEISKFNKEKIESFIIQLF